MATWEAEITVVLRDRGADELYALTGIEPRDITLGIRPTPSGTVSVTVESDDVREAMIEALETAARLAAGSTG